MRQEQGRSKSPAARILSLALALCMIAAFVPAFTLTVGAADSTSVTSDGMLPDTAVAVFDGGLGGADTTTSAISGNTQVSSVWTDWTSSWNGTNSNGNAMINIVNSSDGYVYNSSVSMLALQFYDTTGAEAYVKTTQGYGADSDWFALDYISTTTSGVEDDVAIIAYNPTTGSEVIIDQFETSRDRGDYGFSPAGSSTYTTGYTLTSSSDIAINSYVDWANYRIFVEKGEDTYTVSYYWAANHARNMSYSYLGSKTYSGDLSGYGFGGLQFTRIYSSSEWNNSRIWEPMVYADATEDGNVSVALTPTSTSQTGSSIWSNTLSLAGTGNYLERVDGTTYSGSYASLGSTRYATLTYDLSTYTSIEKATLRMHVYMSHEYLRYSAWTKIGIYQGSVTPSASNTDYLLTDGKIYGGGTSSNDSDYVNKMVYADVTSYITAGESNTLTLSVPIAAVGIDSVYSLPTLIVEYEDTDTIHNVTASYRADGEVVYTLEGTYNTENGDEYYSFPAYYYSANGSSELYYTQGADLSESGYIDMDLQTNPDVNDDYAYGKSIRFDADGDGTDEGYKITSSNLIPNGNFTIGDDGLAGWYTGKGNAATSTYFSNNGDGTLSSTTTDCGTNTDASLLRGWAIEDGATYLFTYTDDMTTGNAQYHKISLSNVLTNDDSTDSGNDVIHTSLVEDYSERDFIFTNSDNYDYVKIVFRWIYGYPFGNFGLYQVTQDDSVLATTTIEYVDGSGNTLQDAQEIYGVVGDVIDLTDTDIVPNTITDENGNIYSKASTDTSFDVTESGLTVTITYETDAVTSVTTATASVISGTTPVLPTSLSATTGQGNATTVSGIVWDTDSVSAQFTSDTVTTVDVTGSAEGITADITATVTVYPLTYELDDLSVTSGGYATDYFPESISGEFMMEFTYTPTGVDNNWIYISNNAALWSGGQVGLGTDNASSGASNYGYFKAQPSTYLGYVENGESYNVFLTIDASSSSYTIRMAKSDGSEVWTATSSFRASADSVNSIIISGYDGEAFGVSDIKVYDANSTVTTYTVNTVVDGSVKETWDVLTSDSADLGYDGEKIFPNVTIPYYVGYIIKSKSVDESAQTVTLTYEAVQEDNFFGDADETATVISLNMLGAHDAFTSNTSDKGDSAQIQCDGSSTSSTAYAAYYGSNVIGASQAQSLDALDLLHAGVRYFDIRLSRSENTAEAQGILGSLGDTKEVPSTNGVFYTTHALLSDEFRTIAYTLSQWAAQHPDEVLILDFQALFDDGSASSTSWSDLADLLDEAGLTDYVVISESVAGSSGSHPLKTSTIADVTENGAHAGVLLFAQTTGSSAESSTFIERRGGSSSDIFSGRLYSNYSDCDEEISDEFSPAYIQSQVDYQNEYTSGDHSIYWQARVMQAQTELTDAQIVLMYSGADYSLLKLAETSNAALYTALAETEDTDTYSYSTWLTALPIVMINGVGDDTTEALVALLKAQNVKQDVTVNYTCGDTTITKTEQLMVGTIYTKDQYAIVHDDTNGNYYVNNAYKTSISDCTLGDIVRVPSPSSASGATIEIPVTEIGDSIYSIGYRTYASGVDVSDGGVLYSSASAVGSAADNPAFSAYNWSTFDNTDRVGVAIMTAPEASAIEKYTLDVTNARDYSTGGLYTYFYIVTLDEYNSTDISDSTALETLFDDDNLIATYNNSANNNNTDGYEYSFELDKETLDKYANQEVVILGTSSGGLYGLSSISIGTSEMDYGVNLYVGAQIRVGSGMGTDPEDTENYQELLGDSGLRFIATVDTTNTVAADADKDLELDDGTLGMNVGIAIFNGGTDTAEFAASAETCTADNLIATIPAKKYQYTGENGSDYVFTAAITNIKESNYNRIYVAVPYVVVGGETYYNYAGAVARTPYQVAKGILVDSDTTTGYNYEADADMLVNVLNVYTNKTGARITLAGESADDYSVVEMTYANGATAFFTASGETQSDGSYVITIAPIAETDAEFYDYADQYYRVNNARSAFETALNAKVELVNGNLVITIPASE